MNYHAPTNQFTVEPKDLVGASAGFIFAIRNIRIGAGLDLRGYDWLKTEINWAQIAEDAIISAAADLGINLGAPRPGQLDVSKS